MYVYIIIHIYIYMSIYIHIYNHPEVDSEHGDFHSDLQPFQ